MRFFSEELLVIDLHMLSNMPVDFFAEVTSFGLCSIQKNSRIYVIAFSFH